MSSVIRSHRSYFCRWFFKYTFYHIFFCLCVFVCICAWMHIWMWTRAPKCSFKDDRKYFIWYLNASKSGVIPSLHHYSLSLPSSILTAFLLPTHSPYFPFFLPNYISVTYTVNTFIYVNYNPLRWFGLNQLEIKRSLHTVIHIIMN